MLTCKQFLQELNDYLDPSIDPETKRHLESHVAACPNCFVVVDTTKKTIQVYKGMEATGRSRRSQEPSVGRHRTQNRSQEKGTGLNSTLLHPSSSFAGHNPP